MSFFGEVDPLAAGAVGFDRREISEAFRRGKAPREPLDGVYSGRLLSLELGWLTRPFEALARRWMPWRGKRFEAERQRGSNLIDRSSLPILRLVWPTYRGVEHAPGPAYRALAFSTEARSSALEPGHLVLAIDYDRPENPRLGVRQILDELVEIEPGVFLGQVLLRVPSLPGSLLSKRKTRIWRLGYFALRSQGGTRSAGSGPRGDTGR